MPFLNSIFTCSNTKDEEEDNKFIYMEKDIKNMSSRINRLEATSIHIQNKLDNDIKRLEDKLEIKLDVMSQKIDALILTLSK